MVSCQEICKKYSHIRSQHNEELPVLQVIADKKFWELSYVLFWRKTCGFCKKNGTHWSRIINRCCCAFLRRSSFPNIKIMETIPNQKKSCPKACGRLSKGYNSYRWSLYCLCREGESKSDLLTLWHLWLQRSLVRRYLFLLCAEGYK